MTPFSNNNRLAYVLEGPWAQKATAAEEFLAQKRQTTLALRSSAARSLTGSPPTRARTAELTNIFRPHWTVPITSAQERALRDSFAEALNTLQLLELGIEMGYYSTEQLRETVLAKFDALFWSQASVDYLAYYQYVNVRFLAARYGVNLNLPIVTPPPPNPGAEVRYATFLAIFSQFYADAAVTAGLNFLDDRLLFENEHQLLAQFLTEGSAAATMPPPVAAHIHQVSEGFYKLILWLNDVFEIVSEDEKKYFALFFSYWLLKLLGYAPTPAGYVQDGTDWVGLLSRSPTQLLLAGGYELSEMPAEDQAAAKELVRQRLRTIQAAWQSAQAAIEASTY